MPPESASTITTATVVFQPDGQTISVPTGTRLSRASADANVHIDAPCGDRGICGKCRVHIVGKVSPLSPAESRYLSRQQIAEGWRLSCQTIILGDCTVTVPRTSLQIAVDGAGREIAVKPSVRKIHLEIPPADIVDATSAFSRLKTALQTPNLRAGRAALRSLAFALKSVDGVTAVLAGDELIAVEQGDTTAEQFGLAFDIGTTTVVGALVDLRDGREVAVAASLNEQSRFGADVISRIKLANEDPTGLDRLNERIVAVLNSLITRMVEQADARRDRIYEVTLVGNTCMHHLALGVHPGSLGEAPYVAVVQDAISLPAGEVGLDVLKSARVYFVPIIAGHVGADTVGVILSTGIHHSDDIRLAVDIGTNGESVLGSSTRMVACSTAAGPAFEGTSILHGMRASDGAIQEVRIDDDVTLNVIGGSFPTGICGTGLIDAVAELRLAGLIDENGRLCSREDAPEGTPPALRHRLIQDHGTRAFRLSPQGSMLVTLTQKDIRELQLAKAAIFAGIQILMRELGVTEADLAEIDLAGAFGSYIRPDSARTIGLIPNVPLDRVRSVGNAARVGARLALISSEARAEAEHIARTVEHQELFAREEFMEAFSNAMLFPELPLPDADQLG